MLRARLKTECGQITTLVYYDHNTTHRLRSQHHSQIWMFNGKVSILNKIYFRVINTRHNYFAIHSPKLMSDNILKLGDIQIGYITFFISIDSGKKCVI